jgi:hypothetical protein
MSITNPMGISNKRVGIVYFLGLLETTLLIILVFAKPIYDRIEFGIWERYNINLKWTLSLDVHVIFGVILLLALIFQSFLIFTQKPGQISKTFSRFYLIIVLYSVPFSLVATWNVYVRTPIIERQILFYLIIFFFSFYLIRGYIALKNNDYTKFLDSFIGAFVLAGVAATIRLFVPIYILIFGLPTWTQSFQNLLLLSASCFICLKLFLIYGLAGRLQQNTLILSLLFISILLTFVFLPCPLN